jgi:hypothetical protein
MGEYTRLIPDLLSLHYKVEDDPRFRMENEACYEEIKKLLEDVGCYLKLEDGILSVSLRTSSNSVYMQKRKRNSGKKKRLFRNMDSSNPHSSQKQLSFGISYTSLTISPLRRDSLVTHPFSYVYFFTYRPVT